MTTKSEDTRGTLPFHLDFRAQAAVLADLPESVAREAGDFYEGCPLDLKSDSMQHAWKQVLRPYLIGLRDRYPAQERPAPGEPVGWWYEDKTGCVSIGVDMALGRRHEDEYGAKLNLLYGTPLPEGKLRHGLETGEAKPDNGSETAGAPALSSPAKAPGISRKLMGKIVDEVFGGAIEDASVIEDIYAVIMREAAPPSSHVVGRWLPIAQADKAITDVKEFSEVGITIKTSDRYWVRDEDGRTYEAAWSEGRYGRDYWWDFEAESPVDPVEFMPHPLDPRWSALSTTEGQS